MVVPRALRIALGTVLAVLSLFAFAGGTQRGRASAAERSPTAHAAVVARIRIRATEFRLSPSRPRVRRPGVVVFKIVNRGSVVHALKVKVGRRTLRTRNVRPGRSARLRVRFRKPGKYPFWCPVDGHRQLGMSGRIIVKRG